MLFIAFVDFEMILIVDLKHVSYRYYHTFTWRAQNSISLHDSGTTPLRLYTFLVRFFLSIYCSRFLYAVMFSVACSRIMLLLIYKVGWFSPFLLFQPIWQRSKWSSVAVSEFSLLLSVHGNNCNLRFSFLHSVSLRLSLFISCRIEFVKNNNASIKLATSEVIAVC